MLTPATRFVCLGMTFRYFSTLTYVIEGAKRARLLISVLCLALLASILLYHYATRFSDSLLFDLKLIAFASSTILGVVAVLTDFKDEEHKITKAGQWNLVALLLAGAIGGVTLKAEYVKSISASENMERTLDPLPETIEVKYSVTIPFSSNITAKALADNLLNQVRDPNFKAPFRSHTTVNPRLGGEVIIYFDKKSPLLPTWDGLPLGLETDFFYRFSRFRLHVTRDVLGHAPTLDTSDTNLTNRLAKKNPSTHHATKAIRIRILHTTAPTISIHRFQTKK